MQGSNVKVNLGNLAIANTRLQIWSFTVHFVVKNGSLIGNCRLNSQVGKILALIEGVDYLLVTFGSQCRFGDIPAIVVSPA